MAFHSPPVTQGEPLDSLFSFSCFLNKEPYDRMTSACREDALQPKRHRRRFRKSRPPCSGSSLSAGLCSSVTCVSTGSGITAPAAPFSRHQQPCVVITPPHVQREAKHGRHIQRQADSKHDSTVATSELLFLTHEKNGECKNPRPLTKSSHPSGENAAFLFTAAFSLSSAVLVHSAPLIELSRQIVP